MSYIAALGRQSELGIAELESLFPNSIERVFGTSFVFLNEDIMKFATRLGGTMKLTKLLATLDTTDWPALEKYVAKASAEHQATVPEGKLTIGLSAFGFMITPRIISHSSLLVKKAVKATGRSVRLVPNTSVAMNSAQVIHNKLTSERGWEICFIRDGKKTHITQTIWEQDIEAYAARDQARPKRDARVGMLPPKLAQTIINLATPSNLVTPENKNINELVILDPFCGTGVVLQEASLMGYKIYGTDIDPRMVDYSSDNLKWLGIDNTIKLEVGDATKHRWQEPINYVACETFLGTPMSGEPSIQSINDERHRVQKLLRQFLKNLASQLPRGTSCCFAIPVWFSKNKRIETTIIDELTDLGYTLSSFRNVSSKDLIYRRQGQVVGRQLITCRKS